MRGIIATGPRPVAPMRIGQKFQPHIEIRGLKKAAAEILVPAVMDVKSKFNPINVMYMGRRGRGKTQGMTYIAGMTQQRIKYLKGQCLPRKVASNYWTAYSDYIEEDLVGYLSVDALFSSDAWGLYCVVDEIASQVANRRAVSRDNLNFGNMLTQIRKLNTEIAFTTQFPQWVDMMTLYQIDLFVMMDGYAYDWEGMPTKIHCYVWDYFGQFTGDIRRKRWPPAMEDVDAHFTIMNANIVKGKYHTEQVVIPKWLQPKHASEDDYGWVETFPEEVQRQLEIKPPTNLEEFCEQQNADGFSFKGTYVRARRLDPDIKVYEDYRARLASLGYTVDGDTVHRGG